MSESIVLVQLAGRYVALPASEIESIIEIDNITPVPGTPPHVVGLSTLRSQALTVISWAHVLEPDDSSDNDCRKAAVIKNNGHHYALLLDTVEDVVELDSSPSPVLGGVGEIWSTVALGMVDTDSGAAMMVDVAALINIEAETKH